MASPLTFRVVVDVDTSKVKPAVGDVETLKRTITGISTNARTATQGIDQFGQSFTDFSLETEKGSDSIAKFSQGLTDVSQSLRLFRRGFLIAGLIASPFILLIKREQELEQQTLRLSSKLEQLGQTGLAQGANLKRFSEFLQLKTGASAKDTLQSFDVIIQKTRSLAGAEGIVSASRKISIATGEKQAKVTQAIVDALDGNTSSLEQLTLKTRAQILELVRTNSLASELDNSFTNAANRGLNTFSGGMVTLFHQTTAATQALVNLIDKLAVFQVANVAKFLGSLGFDTTKQKVDELHQSFDKLFITTKPDLTSIDGIKNAVGLIDDKLKSIRNDLKNPLLPPQAKKDAVDLYAIFSQQRKVLKDLLGIEQDLPSAKREQLRIETDLLDLQRKQLILQNVLPGTSREQSIQQEAEKQLRHRIQTEKEAQIDLEVIDQVRQLRAQKIGNVEEQVAKVIADADLKKIQSRIALNREDVKIQSETLQRINNLKKAQLDLFEFEKELRGRSFGKSDDEFKALDEKSFDRRKKLLIETAKQQEEADIASGKSTDESRLARAKQLQLELEKIEEDRINAIADEEERVATLSPIEREKEKKALEERRKRLEDLRDDKSARLAFSFKSDIDEAAKKSRVSTSTDTTKKLAEAETKGFLTNSQEKALNDFKALEALLAKEKVKVNIDFQSNREQIINIGTEIAQVFYNTLKKLLPQKALVAQAESSAKQGAEKAGAENAV